MFWFLIPRSCCKTTTQMCDQERLCVRKGLISKRQLPKSWRACGVGSVISLPQKTIFCPVNGRGRRCDLNFAARELLWRLGPGPCSTRVVFLQLRWKGEISAVQLGTFTSTNIFF